MPYGTPQTRTIREREERPAWKDAVNGIGFVLLLSAGVAAIGAVLSVVVALIF